MSISIINNAIQTWLTSDIFDREVKVQIEESLNNELDLSDQFYKELEFGTGGMRGLMGFGTNRVNKYTFARATKGICSYLKNRFKSDELDSGVVIAYDTRNNSYDLAYCVARTFAYEGIKAHLFSQPTATPELSFAVRHLNCVAGIVITASHNPKEYNGYKVYNEHGCQITDTAASDITEHITKVSYADLSFLREEDNNYLDMMYRVDNAVDRAFKQAVLEASTNIDLTAAKQLSVVYTPLHGVGKYQIPDILRTIGIGSVELVKEQFVEDGNFPTVKYPNPEEAEALQMGIDLANQCGGDIVLGTDPDADRVGVAVRHGNKFIALTGNQIGALLTKYIIETKVNNGTLGQHPAIIKTIVTSDLGVRIAEAHNVSVIETLTGFKYIGEKICEFEENNKFDFILGYEESYGYLAGMHARDKDAVVASMLICEMTAAYKASGLTLLDVLSELYTKFGYTEERLFSYTLMGKNGVEKMNELMTKLRMGSIVIKDDGNHIVVKDYLEEIEGLPKSNVIKMIYSDSSWIAVRPSGTEPKIKFYVSMRGASIEETHNKLDSVRLKIDKIMDEAGRE